MFDDQRDPSKEFASKKRDELVSIHMSGVKN